MNPDNIPAAYTLRAAMARPGFDHTEWRKVFAIVRQQTGKAYNECTNGEVKAALKQHQTDRHFDAVALHAIVESCGCRLAIPTDANGQQQYAATAVRHECQP